MKKRILFAPATALLLASLACNAPSLASDAAGESSIPAATTAEAPTPTLTAALPPSEAAPTPWLSPTFLPDAAAVRARVLDYKDNLVAALADRDWATLRMITRGNHTFVGNDLHPLSEDALIEALETEHLASRVPLTEVDFGYWDHEINAWHGSDFDTVLGYDVKLCCDSRPGVEAAVLVDGWGPQGGQQAILVFIGPGMMDVFWWGFFPVSGYDPADEAPPAGNPLATIGGFRDALEQALSSGDAAALASLMADPFKAGIYATGCCESEPAQQAADQMMRDYEGGPTAIAIPQEQPLLSTVLPGGSLPAMTLKDIAPPLEAIWYSTGWGSDNQNTLLYVIQQPDDTYALAGILWLPEGY